MKKYLLNGEIADFEFHNDFWDFCSPKGLRSFLDTLDDGEAAEIEINSPGGDVFAGVEMANMIKNSKADITAHVTGIAASMASVIACACDHIKMEQASFMMIHDPWSIAIGNADDLRKEAGVLDRCKEVIMSFYRAKFARTDEELAALMSDETWYTGAECLANGLDCEVIQSDVKIAAKLTRFNVVKMPEPAAALYSFKEMDADTKAAIDAARAEQLSQPAPAASAPTAQPAPAASAPASAPCDWEARYKGASQKINQLQTEIAASAASVKSFQDQLGQCQKDLASANAQIEQLKATVDEGAKALAAREKDLAAARDSLSKAESEVKRLNDARQLLTAGVLSRDGDRSLHGFALIRSKN